MNNKYINKFKSHRYLTGILNIFSPPICPLCENNIIVDDSGVCFGCKKGFSKIIDHCKVCGIPFGKTFGDIQADMESRTCGGCIKDRKFFKKSRSVVKYNENISKAITSFKYYNGFPMEKVLSNLICERALLLEKEEGVKFDIIVPVPLHRTRLKSRGYNQSLLLARAVASRLSAELGREHLVRIKDTNPQVGLKPKARMANVRGAFSLSNKGCQVESLKGKVVLLVDDVYTTGATINECAKVLSKVSKVVYGLTVAGTVVEN